LIYHKIFAGANPNLIFAFFSYDIDEKEKKNHLKMLRNEKMKNSLSRGLNSRFWTGSE